MPRKNTDHSVKNENGNTALHLTLRYSHLEIMKLLYLNNANINVSNNAGDTPLHRCICQTIIRKQQRGKGSK